MNTHAAIVTVGAGLPLEVHQIPTPQPRGNEVRVRVEWTAATPLDLHQADGGLLVNPPQILGDGVVGPVVEVGPEVSKLQVGDIVFGFTWRTPAEKAYQEFVVAPEFLLGRVPDNITKQQAVTVPNNFVTAWHTLTKDFGFELPWPKPDGYVPKEKDRWILIWGGSSSSGQYALQILKWYGYANLITTASKTHHQKLRGYGAVQCFDYRGADVENAILSFVNSQSSGNGLGYVLDCIGSAQGSVMPISHIVREGAEVAVLLPVIVRDAAPGIKPIYMMEVEKAAEWPLGVHTVGVRTHFYLDNEFLKERLQNEIMPTVLEKGIIEPNEQLIVEGETLLERVEKGLSLLREKKVSGARLVWRVSDAA